MEKTALDEFIEANNRTLESEPGSPVHRYWMSKRAEARERLNQEKKDGHSDDLSSHL
jgi:hypothetical protein